MDWEDLPITIINIVRDQYIGDFRDSPTIPNGYENSQNKSVPKSPPPKKRQRTSANSSKSKTTASKSTASKSTAAKSTAAKSTAAKSKEKKSSAKSTDQAGVNVGKRKQRVNIKSVPKSSSGVQLKHLFGSFRPLSR